MASPSSYYTTKAAFHVLSYILKLNWYTIWIVNAVRRYNWAKLVLVVLKKLFLTKILRLMSRKVWSGKQAGQFTRLTWLSLDPDSFLSNRCCKGQQYCKSALYCRKIVFAYKSDKNWGINYLVNANIYCQWQSCHQSSMTEPHDQLTKHTTLLSSFTAGNFSDFISVFRFSSPFDVYFEFSIYVKNASIGKIIQSWKNEFY